MRIGLVTTLSRNQWYFNAGLVERFAQEGWEVHLVSSMGPELEDLRALGAQTHQVEFVREPSPLQDLKALARATWVFIRNRFDVVVVSTPKGGLLGAFAVTIAGQRRRLVYVVRGRVYENERGLRRTVLAGADRITCRLANQVVAISPSLRNALDDERICPASRVLILGEGSSKGVDLERFSPQQATTHRGAVREGLGLERESLVVGYLGWLRREKGTNELVAAFLRLASRFDDLYLLLVGDLEGERDPLEPATLDSIRHHKRIRHVTWTNHPERFLAAMDLFAFPSWREGFGSVLLEAQAMGLPIVASDIPGVRDAIRFGESALPCIAGDEESIEDALATLLGQPGMRERMGASGLSRATQSFSKERIEDLWVELALSVARKRRRSV